MGEKSRRKGPAPRHADGKLGRTCDHPYAPWSFTPSSRAPTAWVRPPCPVWASRLQEHSPEPRRARAPPTRRAQAALYAPALRLRDHLDHFSILMTSCTSWLQAPQAPGLCRDEQSSRISVPQLSGAPILLPDLEGTKLSNFQEMGSHSIVQAGLELLASNNPPASASPSAGITGIISPAPQT
ncbi:C17orf51 isoform 2 [Pan troglodytes]|uniref:C17orf51 isoform 2 n=2 Tax=Pan troglodytes TaxID=9598 RepID=A0A663DB69_PANTR|nr:C17orf51 isoform 2 [Pan troglodytes]